MSRVVLCALAVLLCVINVSAQFDVEPKGPFTRFTAAAGISFQIKLTDPNVSVDYYRWNLFVNDGVSTRSLRSLEGADKFIFVVSLADVPAIPQPQLAVTLTLRNRFSPTPYTVTKVYPVQYVDPLFTVYEQEPTYDPTLTLKKRIVGENVSTTYGMSEFPINATEASIQLIGPRGDTLQTATKTGNPYLLYTDDLGFQVSYGQWPGGLRLRSNVKYESGPAGGHTLEQQIPDSIPTATIFSSAGFGPFRRGVDVLDTFTVSNMGPLCTGIEWSIQYTTPNGLVRTPVRDTIPYDVVKGSAKFIYNMRDVNPGSRLIVRGFYGPFLPPSGSMEPLTTVAALPTHSITGELPVIPGTDRAITVMIDSLPPRIIECDVLLTSAVGNIVQQKTIKPSASKYLSSASISFNARDLTLGTYVVRTRARNDMGDDIPDFFFGFDVRDTSKYFLIADSWGPYTQGDSATITPALTDVRNQELPGWSAVGRFVLVDSTKPNVPLRISPEIRLDNVGSRDSVVYWPDSSYVFGEPITRRARILTSDLPITTKVLFEKTLLSPSNERSASYSLAHPVFVVPSPGVLTSSPRLDSVHIATRNSPLRMTFSNVIPEATAVRFTVTGMRNKTPIVEQIVPVTQNSRSASLTIDAGKLPVNAQVVVSILSDLSDSKGYEVSRLINTRPDTLTMVAQPPIDTVLMEWDIDPATQLIRGIGQLNAALSFSKIPAQTRDIQVLSYDDVGAVIDSLSYPVPYRLSYDSLLTVDAVFPLRRFTTSQLQVRYMSDGGPDGGIRYTKSIVTKFREPLAMRVRKMNVTTTPPSFDKSPILQGSDDIVEFAIRWRAYDAQSTVGYNSPLAVDSVRLEILDCSGSVIDRMLVRPTPSAIRTGNAADTLYKITKLPLSVSSVRARVYSASMHLPHEGVLVSAPFSLRTNPVLHVPLGVTYPTFRVSDTTTATLNQQMAITNLNAVVEIDSFRIRDNRGTTVATFPSQRALGDTITLPSFNFNTLIAERSPFVLSGVVRTATCADVRYTGVDLGTINVQRVMPDSNTRNWVYSTQGWGPFQQGRAPVSAFLVNVDPSVVITSRSTLGDSLEIGLRAYSRELDAPITNEIITGFGFSASTQLPQQVRARADINLTSLDTSSSIAVRVRWLTKTQAGVTPAANATYYYPVSMLPFPDQPIDPDTTRYEQSVLAGAPGQKVMQSNYNFGMRPESSDIDLLRFTMFSSAGQVLDTFSIKPVSRNTTARTSVFQAQRDVAQYPWPHIARDRDQVAISIGYQFAGATRPTKIQKTSIRILPRAEWLNGSFAQLNGTPTATSIPVSVSIPMPASTFTSVVPVFGLISYWIKGDDSDSSTNLVVQAAYNPATRGFTIGNSAPGGSFWVPTISLAGGASYTKESTARDGQKSDDFEALYRFEEAPLADNSDTVVARELRVRSLYQSSYGGAVSMVRWIIETKEMMENLIKTASLVASGGLVSITPTFTIDASVQQVSTVNIGTEERGSLIHVGEERPTTTTEANEFPTSQSMAFTLTGGGGIEASLLGLIGVGAAVSDDYMFASGSVFSGPTAGRESLYYPTRLNYSRWFSMELSLFFGIINIDLFRGRMLHLYDPQIMPSYVVFDSDWESVFTGYPEGKRNDRTQVVNQIAMLPVETPYYRPAPVVAGSDSALVTVHLEQSLVGSTGRMMLSTLDQTTHSLRPTAVIAENRNAMHDPSVALVGENGSALVAWLQNDVSAFSTPASLEYMDLLRTENVHAAFYDADADRVIPITRPADATERLIDGKPSVAVARDNQSAAIAWSALEADSSFVDVYIRKIVRSGPTWQYDDAVRVLRLPGIDRDVSVTAVRDGSYLVTWINEDVRTKTARLFSGRLRTDGEVETQLLALASEGTQISDVEMVSNGERAFMVYARSYQTEEAEFNRSIEVFRYRNGSWGAPRTIEIGSDRGVCRHIDADLNSEGNFVMIIDAVDYPPQGSAERVVSAVAGSIDDLPSAWKIYRNHPSFSEENRATWHLSTAIGPNNTFYIASQELDTLRDNRQNYRNGLQLGPSRCNAVIRALRINQQGELISVPFSNAPVSVDESSHDGLERTLRYRVKVMDAAPNPVREACVVPLAVQRATTIDAKLYDAVGGEVATLYSGLVAEGIQGVSFEVSNLVSGHYTVVVSDHIGIAGSVPIVVIR
jgi:hypothetical protein